jgi:hypothetical protein
VQREDPEAHTAPQWPSRASVKLLEIYLESVPHFPKVRKVVTIFCFFMFDIGLFPEFVSGSLALLSCVPNHLTKDNL